MDRECIINLISNYEFLHDDIKRDILCELKHKARSSVILARFINGCSLARTTGSESRSNDPEYRQIITELVEAGADVKVGKGIYSPIHDAASKGEVETMKFLVEHGADMNSVAEYPDRPIHFAAYNGHVGIICHLLA